jgi:hypothetical protein
MNRTFKRWILAGVLFSLTALSSAEVLFDWYTTPCQVYSQYYWQFGGWGSPNAACDAGAVGIDQTIYHVQAYQYWGALTFGTVVAEAGYAGIDPTTEVARIAAFALGNVVAEGDGYQCIYEEWAGADGSSWTNGGDADCVAAHYWGYVNYGGIHY